MEAKVRGEPLHRLLLRGVERCRLLSNRDLAKPGLRGLRVRRLLRRLRAPARRSRPRCSARGAADWRARSSACRPGSSRTRPDMARSRASAASPRCSRISSTPSRAGFSSSYFRHIHALHHAHCNDRGRDPDMQSAFVSMYARVRRGEDRHRQAHQPAAGGPHLASDRTAGLHAQARRHRVRARATRAARAPTRRSCSCTSRCGCCRRRSRSSPVDALVNYALMTAAHRLLHRLDLHREPRRHARDRAATSRSRSAAGARRYAQPRVLAPCTTSSSAA